MNKLFHTALILMTFSAIHSSGQYVVRVQHQILYDVLKLRELTSTVALQDSLIATLKVDVASLHQTIGSCRTLNTDYLTQISYLKQINFDSNKEIIILTKEKKRLKRQTFWLKVLIPVAVVSTIYLMK